jgi:hypothetical protein
MDYVDLGNVKVSRFILGSNPFSGFSHLGTAVDQAMQRYYTTDAIKRTIREAEGLGVNTLIARADAHVMRMLLEYWDQGGTIQWFAQTCPELGDPVVSVNRAASAGARSCYIHGGVMDHLLANGRLDEIPRIIDLIRSKGMLAGIAGHNVHVFEWAEQHLDVDYYMCCYYNPTDRSADPAHVAGSDEYYGLEDREAMTTLIAHLSRPAIHYKVLAAGRNDPAEAFGYVARHLRASDAVCVGVYTQNAPQMLADDVRLLSEAMQRTRPAAPVVA